MFAGLGLCGFSGYKQYMLTTMKNKVKKIIERKNSMEPNSAEWKMKMNISTLQPASMQPKID
jgi:hypothetical protein